MRHGILRHEIIETARRMNTIGLNQGTAGNISARAGDHFLITPSGAPYDTMREPDIVEMTLDGRVLGGGTPSTEWRFHRDILATRLDVEAVLHAHSVAATAIACLRREIPPFHYMVAAAGGDSIRCTRYALFGTQELSDEVLTALIDRRACLIANHGMIALGKSLDSTLALAVEVETLAKQYCCALQVGEPQLLNAGEMAEVLERFKTYGRKEPRPVRRFSD